MKITEINNILKDIKSLKNKLMNGQDYANASLIRDMEKHYLDKEVK